MLGNIIYVEQFRPNESISAVCVTFWCHENSRLTRVLITFKAGFSAYVLVWEEVYECQKPTCASFLVFVEYVASRFLLDY